MITAPTPNLSRGERGSDDLVTQCLLCHHDELEDGLVVNASDSPSSVSVWRKRS